MKGEYYNDGKIKNEKERAGMTQKSLTCRFIFISFVILYSTSENLFPQQFQLSF